MFASTVETIEIPTADGFAVRGDLYLPAGQPPSGIVILCHGFKGYKSWGFFPYLATCLSNAGIAACSIDYSFNGTFPEIRDTEDEDNAAHAPARGTSFEKTRYLRPDLFRENTLKREYEDLALVLRLVGENGLGHRVGPGTPLGLFGHSRGGVSAFLNALENDRISALCTWAAPDHPDHFTPKQKARWRQNGEYDFTCASDGMRLRLSSRYLDDLERNRDVYDLRRRATELHVPHLIVHGKVDLVVAVARARSLHEAEHRLQDKRIVILRTGHTFGVTDPPGVAPDEPPRPLVEASSATVEWYERYLKKGV
jgi:pimeloyl-ACP methyl ester carboxylesterase